MRHDVGNRSAPTTTTATTTSSATRIHAAEQHFERQAELRFKRGGLFHERVRQGLFEIRRQFVRGRRRARGGATYEIF